MKVKYSTHSVDVLGVFNNSIGETSYYSEHRDLVHVHMVCLYDNRYKYLIQFSISTELEKVRNSMESSKCSTVLLKAETGADVNLMNPKTFDTLFNRKALKFTSLRMEVFGNNSAVDILVKFHAFIGWKGKLFY